LAGIIKRRKLVLRPFNLKRRALIWHFAMLNRERIIVVHPIYLSILCGVNSRLDFLGHEVMMTKKFYGIVTTGSEICFSDLPKNDDNHKYSVQANGSTNSRSELTSTVAYG
jgi:hypothetical protein